MATFKENWLKEDTKCESCGQVTKRQRGLTKQNLKKLVSFKWNLNEVIFIVILIMVLLLAYTYNNETKQCRDWIKPMFSGDEQSCEIICSGKCMQAFKNQTGTNFTNLNFSVKEYP